MEPLDGVPEVLYKSNQARRGHAECLVAPEGMRIHELRLL